MTLEEPESVAFAKQDGVTVYEVELLLLSVVFNFERCKFLILFL
jgi:hypothetical protein